MQPGNKPTSQIFVQGDRKGITGTASYGDAGGGVGSDDVLMSASVSSFSSFSCPAEPSVYSGAEVGLHPVMPADRFISLPSTVQLKESLLPDHPPQHRHRRQWTPRRGSLCSSTRTCGAVESAVTTVRDWVRSAGCSPSKEPRSASVSRRDSLASSFASALVPRDGRWELSRQWTTGADEDDGEERERRAELGGRAAKAGSSSSGGSAVNSGRGWDGVDSWSSSEAQLQPPEGLELACAPTSPQRTPSWRQLHSHPATNATINSSNNSVSASRGNGGGIAAPACSSAYTFSAHSRSGDSTGTYSLAGRSSASAATDCGTAATRLFGWGPNRRGGDGDDGSYGDQLSLSGVSSPSLVTPLPSRRTSAPIASTLQADAPMLSSSPAFTARELAQLGEWRSVAEAQRSDLASTATPTVLSPWPQRPASERHGDGEPVNWCLESLSCASFTSLPNALWNDRDSTAQTPLNWERGGAAVRTGGAYGSSCASPACWSTSELDVSGDGALLDCRSGGRCSPISSPMSVSLADMNGPACVRQGIPFRSPLTSPTTSPSFAHRVHTMDQGCGSGGDDSTMEDIEMRNTKRKCVESPRRSPSATPLSGSFALSLADALAAAPTCMAMSHEAHLWQQQQRRRRTVSPSVARPDEEPLPCDGADTYASTHYRDRSTFSPPSPIRTTAPSMVPVHPPPPLDTPISSSLLATGVRGRPHKTGGGSLHVTSVDAAAGVLEIPESFTGVVVEVDAQHAASLSSCGSGGSGEEPEVDTFSLERAQAAMEDADAEAASALRARQHRLYLLSTSQFAQDVERHGGHVDPMQLELEAEAESEEEDEQEGREEGRARRSAQSERFPGTSCGISAGPRGDGAAQLQWEKDDGPRSRQNEIAADEEGEVLSAPTAGCIPHLHTPHVPLPSPSTVSCATPSAHLAAPVASGRVSREESFVTPLRRGACVSATAAHVRWSEPEGSEDGHSPGSLATTTGSRSRRDVSPPVRERSMAPAELQKEREGY